MEELTLVLAAMTRGEGEGLLDEFNKLGTKPMLQTELWEMLDADEFLDKARTGLCCLLLRGEDWAHNGRDS